MRAVAAQHSGLCGGVDIAVGASLGQQLVRLVPRLKCLDGARLILGILGFPFQILMHEIASPGKHRHARGQEHKLRVVARNIQRQRTVPNKRNRNLVGNVKAEAAVAAEERKQRAVAEEGLLYNRLLDHHPGIIHVFMPIAGDLEGDLCARRQQAQPLILEFKHRLAAVARLECLHHGFVSGRFCVHRIAQLQLAILFALQLHSEGVRQLVFAGAVIGVRFGEDVPAIKAAHNQIRASVILFHAEARALAAAQLDRLHLPGAVAPGLDGHAQLHVAVLVRAHVAHPEVGVAPGIGFQRLRFGLFLPIGHRDLRVLDRPQPVIQNLDSELIYGNDGDDQVRIAGIFNAFQPLGVCGKAAPVFPQRQAEVLALQLAVASVHQRQVCLIIPADRPDRLPDPAFGLQNAAAGAQAICFAYLPALAQTQAVENRQSILLQLRLKVGKGALRFKKLPMNLLHPGIQGRPRLQLLNSLNRAQQAAHPVGQEPVRPLPHLKGIHVRRWPCPLAPLRAAFSGQLSQGVDSCGAEVGRLLAKASRRAQQQSKQQGKQQQIGIKPPVHGRILLFVGIIRKPSAIPGASQSRIRRGAGSPAPPEPVSACLPARPAPAAPAAPPSARGGPQARHPRTG